MPSLTTLKKDMEFMRDMEEIVDIFKMTAMFQFRVLQKKEEINTVFMEELADVWSLLLMGEEEVEGIALLLNTKAGTQDSEEGNSASASADKKKKDSPRAIVLVTTDYGFLGGLNARVIDAVLHMHFLPEDEILVLGERGAYYLEEKRIPYTLFPGIDDDISSERINKISDYLLTGYKKKFQEVFLVYPKFMSLGFQKIESVNLLPYVPSRTPTNKEDEAGQLRKKREQMSVLVEPGKEPIKKTFVELWVGYKLLEVFLSAKLAEYAARIMHLEGSWQEISHLKEGIMFDYFCERHAIQDQTIREISASKVLLKK